MFDSSPAHLPAIVSGSWAFLISCIFSDRLMLSSDLCPPVFACPYCLYCLCLHRLYECWRLTVRFRFQTAQWILNGRHLTNSISLVSLLLQLQLYRLNHSHVVLCLHPQPKSMSMWICSMFLALRSPRFKLAGINARGLGISDLRMKWIEIDWNGMIPLVIAAWSCGAFRT